MHAVTERGRNQFASMAAGAASAHCAGGDMRAELVVGTAGQLIAYAAMQATDGPEFLTKMIGIGAGCCLGALVASVIADRASWQQRIRRFFVSFGAGVFLSLIALWMWPGRAGIDPREWVVVIAFGASFCGWHLMRRFDERTKSAADQVIDAAAERIGFKHKEESEP